MTDQPIQNIRLESLPEHLRGALAAHERHNPPHLYALLDMGRIQGQLREEVADKLETSCAIPLINDPKYAQIKYHCAQLVSDPDGSDEELLKAWGDCNGDVVSAWIVSRTSMPTLARHLCNAAFAYDQNKVRYVLRYYDPLSLPILYRLADKQWLHWFFLPMDAWWYPVATPMEETWSRIEGGGRPIALPPKEPLVMGEELWDALAGDPFPYQLVEFVEKEKPSLFGDMCYGVRLAKIEDLLKAGESNGLEQADDLFIYVTALLEVPSRAEEPLWQAALQKAVANEAPLRTYLTDLRKI